MNAKISLVRFTHFNSHMCITRNVLSHSRINILNLGTCNAENVSGDDELAIIFAQ